MRSTTKSGATAVSTEHNSLRRRKRQPQLVPAPQRRRHPLLVTPSVPLAPPCCTAHPLVAVPQHYLCCRQEPKHRFDLSAIFKEP